MSLYRLYAVSAEGQYLKYGIAKDVMKRVLQMQAGCPFVLRILHITAGLPKKQALKLESLVHRAAVFYHVQGEWFISTPKTLALVEILKSKSLDELPDFLGEWAEEELRFSVKRRNGPQLRSMHQTIEWTGHCYGKRVDPRRRRGLN